MHAKTNSVEHANLSKILSRNGFSADEHSMNTRKWIFKRGYIPVITQAWNVAMKGLNPKNVDHLIKAAKEVYAHHPDMLRSTLEVLHAL